MANLILVKLQAFTEAANRGGLYKKVFLERCSQNSQENTCVRDSILIKLQVLVCKKDTLAQVFSCEFSEISSKNNFFAEHLQTTASNLSFSEATTGGVL